jgi:hypothetical protein
VRLFFSGKPVEVGEAPGIIKTRKFLDKVKDGELLNVFQVAKGAGVSHRTLGSQGYYACLKSYFYTYHQKRYWGNRRTIKALERKDHEQRKRGD